MKKKSYHQFLGAPEEIEREKISSTIYPAGTMGTVGPPLGGNALRGKKLRAACEGSCASPCFLDQGEKGRLF